MATPSSRGRLVRIRLESVPLNIRLRAAERLYARIAREAPDPLTALNLAADVRRAAMRPRGTYVLSADAVERVLGDAQ